MSFVKRSILFLLGLMIMSFGVVLVIVAGLGSSPISSMPYVVSLLSSYTLGEMTFAMNVFFVLYQYYVTRRATKALLMQIPMVLVFSACLDVSMFLLEGFVPETYGMSIATLLAATLIASLGISMVVIANLVILPGEGMVQVIADQYGLDFGYTKIGFDLWCVIMSVIIALIMSGEVCGLREGTVIAAVITGWFVRQWFRILTVRDHYGRMIFHLPFTKKPPSSIIKK